MVTRYVSKMGACQHDMTPTFPTKIIAEADNFKEREFTTFWHKAAKKVSMLILYLGAPCND
jgi:hypothetical protein